MKIIKHSYKKLFFCSLIFLSISFNSLILSNTLESESLTKGDDKYLKQDEWLGLCESGKRQSPVNIVFKGNTINDNSGIEINYELPKDAINKKFYYDGSSIYLDIDLGEIKYYKNTGEVDYYKSHRIEIHFPAEHYITKEKQTPRGSVELQIHHTKTKTEGDKTSEEEFPMRTNRAVISILFTVGEQSDIFFSRMGISKFNILDNGEFNLPKPNSEIDRTGQTPASYQTGFNFLAFRGLLYLLNSDRHIFFYYGSETSPPCREDTLWMVFGEYRSISKFQYDFLNKMIAKPKAQGGVAVNGQQLFGNKRNIKLYDENIRGKILSSQNGLYKLSGTNFFDTEPDDDLNKDD